MLIVTHGDAVNSSVSRLRPWAIVHPVHHTGFTAAYRDEKEGAWPPQPVHALHRSDNSHFVSELPPHILH